MLETPTMCFNTEIFIRFFIYKLHFNVVAWRKASMKYILASIYFIEVYL